FVGLYVAGLAFRHAGNFPTASIDRGWLGPQRITRSVSLEDARSGHSACADLVRSHLLCPLSYGRAFHAQTERKTGRRIVPQRSDSGNRSDLRNVLGAPVVASWSASPPVLAHSTAQPNSQAPQMRAATEEDRVVA